MRIENNVVGRKYLKMILCGKFTWFCVGNFQDGPWYRLMHSQNNSICIPQKAGLLNAKVYTQLLFWLLLFFCIPLLKVFYFSISDSTWQKLKFTVSVYSYLQTSVTSHNFMCRILLLGDPNYDEQSLLPMLAWMNWFIDCKQ